MSRRELLLYAGIGAAILAALVVGTALGWWGSSSSSNGSVPPVKPLTARATLTPHPTLFGDAVTAAVDVQIDPERVDAESVTVVPAFDPFVTTGAPEITRSRAGRHETIGYSWKLECLGDDCVPGRRDPIVLTLKPAVVTASSGGRTVKTTAAWPQTAILSRLQRRDIGSNQPRFRAPRTVPAPEYSVSPSGLASLCSRPCRGARARRAGAPTSSCGRRVPGDGARSWLCSRPRSRTRATPPAATLPTAGRRSSRAPRRRRRGRARVSRQCRGRRVVEQLPSSARRELADEVESSTRNG